MNLELKDKVIQHSSDQPSAYEFSTPEKTSTWRWLSLTSALRHRNQHPTTTQHPYSVIQANFSLTTLTRSALQPNTLKTYSLSTPGLLSTQYSRHSSTDVSTTRQTFRQTHSAFRDNLALTTFTTQIMSWERITVTVQWRWTTVTRYSEVDDVSFDMVKSGVKCGVG